MKTISNRFDKQFWNLSAHLNPCFRSHDAGGKPRSARKALALRSVRVHHAGPLQQGPFAPLQNCLSKIPCLKVLRLKRFTEHFGGNSMHRTVLTRTILLVPLFRVKRQGLFWRFTLLFRHQRGRVKIVLWNFRFQNAEYKL
jgi:hypothetical protein